MGYAMNLQLSIDERDELARLLETAVSDTRIETRRTRNQTWRDSLRNQKSLLQTLLNRLRMLEGE